jgi:aminopeptidase
VNEQLVNRLADLVVRAGANVQPGQIVAISGEPGKEHMVRAAAAAAYRAGAKFVDVSWFDPHVKRARIEHAADDTLDFVPSWYGERMLALGEQHCARVSFSGPTAPGLLDGLDPVRAGRDRLPAIKESALVLQQRTTNWSIIPAPNPVWARLVHPDLEPEQALSRLEEQIAHVCRLDEPDPAAAWDERRRALQSAAARLTERGFDALHYQGPGTDLTIGLLPGARWIAGTLTTVDGIEHLANIPTEEVFTSPDPERVDGIVAASKPLVLQDGTVVRDLRMRFEGGRAVDVESSTAQDVMRTIVRRDEGAARLGEVALVDDQGRIGPLDTVFYDTLLDENAASHIAIGVGFPFVADGEVAERVNRSEIHIDFMIGSPELDVTGITPEGERVLVLEGGVWRI